MCRCAPAEVEGRRGKQPDGSAKTREVKLATMWTAEGRDKAGRPVRDRGSVSYNAAVESASSRDTDPLPSAFAQRAYREAQRRGFDTAARRVVIGDGAPWIWQLAAEQFPGAIEIVDIYHAKQHLCDVAKTLYGPGTDLADQWARDRRAELDAGRLRAVVAALRIHVETTPEARRCIHYVFGNRHRMRYPQFRAKGLCISSGVVRGRMQADRAHGSSAPACAGPSPAPTPSSPSAAACSAAASRTSGSDEPQTPPEGRRPRVLDEADVDRLAPDCDQYRLVRVGCALDESEQLVPYRLPDLLAVGFVHAGDCPLRFVLREHVERAAVAVGCVPSVLVEPPGAGGHQQPRYLGGAQCGLAITTVTRINPMSGAFPPVAGPIIVPPIALNWTARTSPRSPVWCRSFFSPVHS